MPAPGRKPDTFGFARIRHTKIMELIHNYITQMHGGTA